MATTAAASAPPDAAVVDGSLLEGGGQILRNAVSFGAVLSTPVEVVNVRAGRSKPGLRAQHLTGMRLAADICGGRLRGDEIGSTTVRYDPGEGGGGGAEGGGETIVGDTGTAGSICLLLQTALPCAILGAPSRSSGAVRLELRGGTNADMAPQIDYLTEVFLPVASKFGLPDGIDLRVERRGYYPRGGGIVRACVPALGRGAKLRPVRLTERGSVVDVRVRAFHAGKVPRWVAQKMADVAVRKLRDEGGDDAVPRSMRPRVEVVTERSAVGSGSGILMVARTDTGNLLAGSALGRPKVKADVTGRDAANELIGALRDGGCVDEWLQDQLILFMALADGTSEVVTGSLTLHTKTAIMVAEQLTGAVFEVDKVRTESGSPERQVEGAVAGDSAVYGTAGRIAGIHRIRCTGTGFSHK